MKKAIMIDSKDNTATALEDIEVGDVVSLVSKLGQVEGEITAQQAVPLGHKLALTRISEGEKVFKYGEVIGLATRLINKGEYIHVHNVESAFISPPKEVE